MKTAKQLIDFAARIYELQVKSGRVFVHEHPTTAKSWGEPSVVRLMGLKGVQKYELDMCQYNLRPTSGDGFHKKPTTLLTNSAIVGEYLAKKCQKDHQHMPLEGGDRCSRAATYTPEFCEAIVEAYKLHLDVHRKKTKRSK